MASLAVLLFHPHKEVCGLFLDMAAILKHNNSITSYFWTSINSCPGAAGGKLLGLKMNASASMIRKEATATVLFRNEDVLNLLSPSLPEKNSKLILSAEIFINLHRLGEAKFPTINYQIAGGRQQ